MFSVQKKTKKKQKNTTIIWQKALVFQAPWRGRIELVLLQIKNNFQKIKL